MIDTEKDIVFIIPRGTDKKLLDNVIYNYHRNHIHTRNEIWLKCIEFCDKLYELVPQKQEFCIDEYQLMKKIQKRIETTGVP